MAILFMEVETKKIKDCIKIHTGRGATEIVINLKPRISSGANISTAEGGACSV